MHDFKLFFKNEWERFCRPRNLIILAVMAVLCLGFIEYGIIEYNQIEPAIKKFQDFEKEVIKQFQTYTQYGAYGYRIFFNPGPASILFINTCGLPDIESFIDSGVRLKIHNSLKGGNIFKLKIKKLGITDFSGVILFVWTLAALLYGFETLRNREYLKQLTSESSKRKVYISLAASRAVFFTAAYLLLIGCTALLFLLNGSPLPVGPEMGVYLLASLLLLLVCLAAGIVLGAIESEKISIPLVFASWLLVVYLLPAGVNLLTALKSNNMTKLNEMELEKLKIMMAFEKKAIEKGITYRYGEKLTEEVKEYVLEYMDNELNRIKRMEDDLRVQMEANIRRHHLLSSLFPGTFYITVSDEVSSQGDRSNLEFYLYSQDEKNEFINFFIKKLYFSGEGDFPGIENFVKHNENIFNSRSRLPYYTWLGILLGVLEILILLTIGYVLFGRMLYVLPGKEIKIIHPRNFDFEKGKFEAHYISHPVMSDMMYDSLSGNSEPLKARGFDGKITVDNVDITTTPMKESFLYLCSPEDIPKEMTAGSLLNLITGLLRFSKEEIDGLQFFFLDKKALKTRLWHLKEHQVCEILLTALKYKKRSIYLVEDTIKGMPTKLSVMMNDAMEKLSMDGALSIYLTTEDGLPRYRSVDDANTHLMTKSTNWQGYMEGLKKQLTKDEEELARKKQGINEK